MEADGYRTDTTMILDSDEEWSSPHAHTGDDETLRNDGVHTGTARSSERATSAVQHAHNQAMCVSHAVCVVGHEIGSTARGQNEVEIDYEGVSDSSSHDFSTDRPLRAPGSTRLNRNLDNHSHDSLDGIADSASEHSRDASGSDVDDPVSDADDDDADVFVGSDRSEIGDPRPVDDPYAFIARYLTRAEAETARDLREGFVYGFKHNFASKKRKNPGNRFRQTVITAQQAMDWYPYTSLKRSGVKWASTAFVCLGHIACGHLTLITRFETDPPVFELAEKGSHAQLESTQSRFGIYHGYKQRVQDLVLQNYLPSAIHSMLLAECVKAKQDLNLVPSTKQIQNIRSYQQRKLVYTISRMCDVLVWIDGRLCKTRDDFFGADGFLPAEAVHELIVLHWFQQDGVLGFIFTSRAVFRNVKIAVENQLDELVCSADGTYKIHFGGWVLVVCGTVGVVYDNAKREYRHRFFPWAYMFVLTETEFAYTQLFTTVKDYAKIFFDVDVDVKFGSLDHSEAIASAFESVWPAITLLPCWPHLSRAVKKHSQRLGISAAYFTDNIKEDLGLLHNARSHEQFDVVCKAVLADWRKNGASNFADYFEATYLTRRWRRWFITAAKVPGVVPRQQAIEAHNKAIKAAISDILRADTARVLNEGFSRIVLADGMGAHTSGEPIRHYCEGPTPTSMVTKAAYMLRDTRNYHIQRKSRRGRKPVDYIVFNSRKTMELPANSGYAVPDAMPDTVTKERVKVYINSLRGRINADMDVNTMYSALGSLHHVKVLHHNPIPSISLSTRWRLTEIETIRKKLRCDCFSHIETGWLCSHVLVALDVMGIIKLGELSQRLPVRRPRGRPRAVPGALTRDENYDQRVQD